jgi:peptidoglycan/LPS O-acetylase OafA/YrhL
VWIGVLAVFWAPLLWGDRAHVVDALISYGALVQNLARPMRDPDFFDVSWSLAVEEWFYLGFSALLFVVAGVSRRAALPVAVVVFLAGPMALRWWLRAQPGGSDHLVVYWLDCIAVGVVAAWVRARAPRVFAAGVWLLPVAVGLIWLSLHGGLARLGASAHLRRTFDFDLVAVALVLLLPAACLWADARGPVAGAVRVVSRLSYALYLTHLSVMIYVDAKRAVWHLSPVGAVTLSVGLILGLSYAMSRFVERPIMARRPDDRPRHQNSARAAAPMAEAAQASAEWGGA